MMLNSILKNSSQLQPVLTGISQSSSFKNQFDNFLLGLFTTGILNSSLWFQVLPQRVMVFVRSCFILMVIFSLAQLKTHLGYIAGSRQTSWTTCQYLGVKLRVFNYLGINWWVWLWAWLCIYSFQIGASHVETSISLWCVDIKRLKPWSVNTGKRGCPR